MLPSSAECSLPDVFFFLICSRKLVNPVLLTQSFLSRLSKVCLADHFTVGSAISDIKKTIMKVRFALCRLFVDCLLDDDHLLSRHECWEPQDGTDICCSSFITFFGLSITLTTVCVPMPADFHPNERLV